MASTRTKRVIPLPSLDAILAAAGVVPADLDAVKAFGNILEEIAGAIVENARLLAGHAGRSTVSKDDVALGHEHWRGTRGTK